MEKGKKLTHKEEIQGLKILLEKQHRLINYLSTELSDVTKNYFNLCVTMDMEENSLIPKGN